MTQRFRISAHPVLHSFRTTWPLVAVMAAVLALGCSSTRDGTLDEFVRWHDGARAEMRFDSLFASGCLGADEAKVALERTAGLFIQEIVRTATSRCRMNIDLARKKITDEVAKAVVATPREEASDVEA